MSLFILALMTSTVILLLLGFNLWIMAFREVKTLREYRKSGLEGLGGNNSQRKADVSFLERCLNDE